MYSHAFAFCRNWTALYALLRHNPTAESGDDDNVSSSDSEVDEPSEEIADRLGFATHSGRDNAHMISNEAGDIVALNELCHTQPFEDITHNAH